MKRLAIVIVVFGAATASARDLGPRPDGPRYPPCDKVDNPNVRCVGVRKGPPPPRTITISDPLGIDGRVRTISLLQFIERANEELVRTTLETRSFVPKLVQSVDEEAL